MKYLKLFEKFQEGELPYSITIKLNGHEFSKKHRNGPQNLEAGIYSGNYALLWDKELKLENSKYYPLLKLKRGKNEFVYFVYLYIIFNNTFSDFGSKGGGIIIVESPTPFEKISSDFTTFYGPIGGGMESKIEHGYNENCFFPEFTPGAVDNRGYFEIVSVS